MMERMLQVTEICFTSFFTLEMVIKIIARGFILHKHSYLSDPWNWLDFVVVVTGIITLIAPNSAKVSFLRTVRVLRPLRTMTRISGMRPLINTFIRSFVALSNVVMLLLFFAVVFGILGIEFFQKSLRGRCYIDPNSNDFSQHPAVLTRLMSQQVPFLADSMVMIGARSAEQFICSTTSTGGHGSGEACPSVAIDGVFWNTTCSSFRYCMTGDVDRPFDQCTKDFNPNPYDLGAGYFSYDNILSGFLTIFQVLTVEGWTDIYYRHGFGSNMWLSRIFHSAWVFLGCFVIVQLALASLSDAFLLAKEEEKTQKEKEALHDEAILKEDVRIRMNKKMSAFSVLRRRMSVESTSLKGLSIRNLSLLGRLDDSMKKISEFLRIERARELTRSLVYSVYFQRFIIFCIIVNTVLMMINWHDQALFEDSICKRRCDIDPSLPANASGNCVGPLFNRSFYSDGQGGGERPLQTAYCFMENDGVCSKYETRGTCVNSVGFNGMPCHFFPTVRNYTVVPDMSETGACKTALYTSQSFVQHMGKVISLRQLCGDDSTCDSFPSELFLQLNNFNLALTAIFIAEMVLKLFGLGIHRYFQDNFNCFDFFVVISSIVELAIIPSNGSNRGSLSALRAVRLFRLFKLARSWKDMRKILNTLAVALGSMGPLCVIWVMFMYIFALLGMQFFGGRFRYFKTDYPRSNFDNFFPQDDGIGAFVTTFQIISTENWNVIMYNSIMSESSHTGLRAVRALIPIAIVVFGNYIIMNLFISILLQGFGEDDEDEAQEDADGMDSMRSSKLSPIALAIKRLIGQEKPKRASTLGSPNRIFATTGLPRTSSLIKTGEPVKELVNVCGVNLLVRIVPHPALRVFKPKNPLRLLVSWLVYHPTFEFFIMTCILITSITLLLERPDDSWIGSDSNCPDVGLNCSLVMFPGQSNQLNCPRDARDPDFGRVWGACGTPDEAPCCVIKERLKIFQVLDQIFTVVFTLEMTLKILSDGFISHKFSYLRSPWNWLDFAIVIISLIGSFGPTSNMKAFKSLRTFRAIRPLRVIKRHIGLKVVVVCMISSIPAMYPVLSVMVLWFLTYAILGVNFYSGNTYACYDPQNQMFYGKSYFQSSSVYVSTLPLAGPESVPTIIECVTAAGGGLGVWQPKYFGFDNIGSAAMTLFDVSTTEGWMEVMASTTDINQLGVSPLPNQAVFHCIYACVQIIIGNFVLLNLIIGVVIANYTKIKNNEEGITPFLTPEQHEWKEMQRVINHLKPRTRVKGPENRFRNWCFHLATNPWFEYFMTISIVLNVLVMTFKTHDESDCMVAAVFWINFSFAVIFVFEAFVKLVGLGANWYFIDPWNVFDFVVVTFSIFLLVLDVVNGEWSCLVETNRKVKVPALSALRTFRILRVFRLIRRAVGLRQMIQTLLVSLPSMTNIFALLLLIMTIFSVLALSFFYNVNTSQDMFGRMDDNEANYQYFDKAMWMLHRHTTGEAWNGIMAYCSQDDQFLACQKAYGDYLGDGCGGYYLGTIFHVLWEVIGTYVLMQLFTAVILENFHELAHADSATLPLDRLNEFVDAWTELDPDATQKISTASLSTLITRLSPPLGTKNDQSDRSTVMQIIKDLNIPIHQGGVIRYHETFFACVKRVLTTDLEEDEPLTARSSMPGQEEGGDAKGNGGTTMMDGRLPTAAEDFAARSVQSAFREYREKRLQVLKGFTRTTELPINANPNAIKIF